MVVPRFGNKTDKAHEKLFVAQVNRLMQTAWQQAIISGQIQKVLLDFGASTINLEQQVVIKNQKTDTFAPLKDVPGDTSMDIPPELSFVNVYIGGKDEMKKGNRKTAWFFVLPDGTTQPVVMNLRLANDVEIAPPFGMVLNPFNAQFDYYDTPQQP